ncbi:Uclacyanin [Thalictrum thalictroides]|uniref:Uclacyanin n=1 Tax=Thalictrum thalictroides TaxID=46969 RepID=A0A7J6WD76_THATH|nr:Uclacyanin [Thalictrum thalictroides]
MAHYFGLIGCVIVLVALLEGAAAQTTHIVLDNRGWIIPLPEGASVYTNWAATKTFMVGDTLVFNFGDNEHDVAEVTKMAFEACNTTNTIGPILLKAPVNITLTRPGQHYYICTFSQHCSLGQKLAINVSGSPSTAPAPPTPTSSGPTAAEGPTAGCPPETTGPTAAHTPFMPPETSTDPTTAGGPTTTTSTIPPDSASVVATSTSKFLVMQWLAEDRDDYFSVSTSFLIGQSSGQKVEDNLAGNRVALNLRK